MGNKVKLLFINESLSYGGGERSLLTLLNSIDYSKFNVSLQLFRYGSKWERQIPSEVKILPRFPYIEFCELPLFKALLNPVKFKWIISRILFSILLRCWYKPDNIIKSILYWKTQSWCFSKNDRSAYDFVIAYAQGIPTFYVADKCNNTKKIAWINVTYIPDGIYKKFIESKYKKIDKIVAVSETIADLETKVLPSIKSKIRIVRDLINPYFIEKLSTEIIDEKINNDILLLTIGRFTNQKGYDHLCETAKILKERNLNFKWIILGEGLLKKQIEDFIKKNNLEDNIILAGTKTNPYPYIKSCNIYIQPSRHEGFGLAIAEAKILNKPVIVTEFNTARLQIKDRINGLITSFDPFDIADKIELLMKDEVLYNQIEKNLKKEKKGNLEDIEKFYEILEK